MTTFANTLLVILSLAIGPNEEMRVVIEQALDQPTTLSIVDSPLPEAIRTIAEETGLGISIGPETLAFLPYGESTRVSVRLESARLRDGIRTLCDQIGMQYAITDTGVALSPSPPLAMLGRPAMWEELGLLASLMQARWEGTEAEFDSIGQRIRFVELGDDHANNLKILRRAFIGAGTGSGADLLTHACTKLNALWHPWDESIVVISKQAQMRRQLQWPVSLRYQDAPLIEVIHGLAQQASLSIKIDPDTAANLPERARHGLSLIAEGATVEEALAQIAMATGLTYEWRDESIVLTTHRSAVSEKRTRQRDRIVGKVVVHSEDGKHTYEWFIYQSDLSEGERQRLATIKREGIEAMKRDLR